jgi:hypothetical protein
MAEDCGGTFLEGLTDEQIVERMKEAAASIEEESTVLAAGHCILLRRLAGRG